MGVYAYYDGFNFYYRLFKNDGRKHKLPLRYKWLDLLKLSRHLVPGQQIDWIGYFTAEVLPTVVDPTQHIRQKAYLDALGTISCLEVVPGTFRSRTKNGVPRACRVCGGFVGCLKCRPNPNARIDFDTFEEKGSDVNLAARLVRDAARGSFTEAVVISNDSDLEEAVRIATQDFGRVVHVRSPDLYVIGALKNVATTETPLDVKLFKRCLFPVAFTDANGAPITRPATWQP